MAEKAEMAGPFEPTAPEYELMKESAFIVKNRPQGGMVQTQYHKWLTMIDSGARFTAFATTYQAVAITAPLLYATEGPVPVRLITGGYVLGVPLSGGQMEAIPCERLVWEHQLDGGRQQ